MKTPPLENLVFLHCLLTVTRRIEKRREACRRWRKSFPDKQLRACKRWRRNNPERMSVLRKRWASANPEKHRAMIKSWEIRNPEKVQATKARYLSANRKKHNARCVQYVRENPVATRLRTRIQHALRGVDKAARTLELLGCSVQYLRDWLAWQFVPGMTWENYGQWHVDHIKPCAAFDLNDPAQQRECFNYMNLQPLWAKDNLMKGARCG